MESNPLNPLARMAAAPKASRPLLDSVPKSISRGNGIRPRADSRGYKGTCKKFTVPSAEKDVLWKIKKKTICHLNSCARNTFVSNERVSQTCLNGNGPDFNGNAVLVAI